MSLSKENKNSILRLPCTYDLIPMALLFLSTRSSILGIRPFTVAMFCSIFDLQIGYLGIVSAVLGLLTVGELKSGIIYLSAMLLFWLYTKLRPDYKNENLLSATVCGFLLFVCGSIQMLFLGFTIYNFILLVSECLICSFFYSLFLNANSLLKYSKKPPTDQELISGAVCVGVFVSGLNGISIPPGIDISKIISVYIVMSVAMNMSLAVSGSCGLAAGIICNMNDENAITLMGLYGLSAIFGNLLKGFKKYGVALGFLGSYSITMLYIGNSVKISAIEILCACFLFVITPNRIHNVIGCFLNRTVHADIVPAEKRMREYLLSRLLSASKAFSELSVIFKDSTEKRINSFNRDLCVIIDNVTERVCASCPYAYRCLETDKANTYRLIFSALETIENVGYCNSSNVTPEFNATCHNINIFLCELMHSYELYKRETVIKNEYIYNRDLILSQYEEFSEIFSELYDELGSGFRFVTETEEKLASELIKSGYSLREIRVIENGISETEIYIALNKPANKNNISEFLEKQIGMPFEYRESGLGGMMKFKPKAIYNIEFGEKQVNASAQLVSGDTLVTFRTNSEKFYVILCDGMGSGKNAGRESRITGKLLEEFLKNGFCADTAVSMVNSSLAMSIKGETFSSVDLLSIDMITGNADFYKLGGCKSYIKRKNNIETIFSPSLPVGIMPNVHISGVSKRLENNDLIIMMSDGAEGSGYGFLSSEKVKKMLTDDDKSMNDIANAIVKNVCSKTSEKIKDDITVAAIRITKNV